MSKRGVLAMAFSVAGLTFACGDDDDESSAVRKCQEFQELWCNKAIDCAVSEGFAAQSERAAVVRECLTAARAALPCARAVSVSPSFDDCLMDVTAMTCEPFIPLFQGQTMPSPLPATCAQVVQLR